MINAEITRPKITIVSGIAVKIRPFVKFLSSSATAPIAAEPMLLCAKPVPIPARPTARAAPMAIYPFEVASAAFTVSSLSACSSALTAGMVNNATNNIAAKMYRFFFPFMVLPLFLLYTFVYNRKDCKACPHPAQIL